jgi:hypothetical protein
MSIRFSCPSCNSIYTVGVEHAGRKSECKSCGQRLEVPAPQTPRTVLGEITPTVEPLLDNPPVVGEKIVTITCPSCGHQADAPASYLKREATCPHCSTAFNPSKPAEEFNFREQSSALAVYRQPRRRDEYDEDDEDYRPRRRRRRRRDYDDDGYGYRCPYCDTRSRPYRRSQISAGGWITFALMLLFCWPLFWIGLLITEEYSVCSRCGLRLG